MSPSLMCIVVDGSGLFEVQCERGTSIDELASRIKTQLKRDDELALYRVSYELLETKVGGIYVYQGEDITVGDVADVVLRAAERMLPRHSVKEYFPNGAASGLIHVVVASANRAVYPRYATRSAAARSVEDACARCMDTITSSLVKVYNFPKMSTGVPTVADVLRAVDFCLWTHATRPHVRIFKPMDEFFFLEEWDALRAVDEIVTKHRLDMGTSWHRVPQTARATRMLRQRLPKLESMAMQAALVANGVVCADAWS